MVALGGEVMGRDIVERWAARVRLLNLYGCTEATVYQLVSTPASPPASPSPIPTHTSLTGAHLAQARRMAEGDSDKLLGSPLPGVRVAVVPVDTPPQHLAHAVAEQLAFQPPAASPAAWPAYEALSDAARDAAPEGELIIVGTQVAHGYTGPSAASASKFGEMPARGLGPGSEGQHRRARNDSLLHAPSERWVRTGDIVQRRPQGLVFVGRVDRQLKLEGVRCNLAEIEGVLRTCGLVREAVVVLSNAEDKVAHGVARSTGGTEGGAQSNLELVAQSKKHLVAAVQLEPDASSHEHEHLDADRRLALHLALELHCKRLLPGRAPCSPVLVARQRNTPTLLLPRSSVAPCLRARRLAAAQA